MHYKSYLKFVQNLFFTRKDLITDRFISVLEIPFEDLRKNADLVIFDYDDTLAGHHEDMPGKTKQLLIRLKGMKYKIAFLSNCSSEQLKNLDKLSQELKIYNSNKSNKPSQDGYIQIMDKLGSDGTRTVMVGDRIGTDIFGAYLAGIRHRILVKPYSYLFGGKKLHPVTRMVRDVEKLIYNLTRSNKKLP